MARPASPEVLAALAASTRRILGSDVRARAAKLEDPLPPLHPDEAVAIANAADKRRREFAWGRALARALLEEVGDESTSVPRRPDRAPGWPPNVWGSISHTDEVALVAVTRGAGARASFGVDLEGGEPLAADLVGYVLRPEERARLGSDDGRLAKVVFSAKEAFYKAQHRHTGVLLDFLDVSVALDSARRVFEVSVHHAAKSDLPSATAVGGWDEVGAFIVTAVRFPTD